MQQIKLFKLMFSIIIGLFSMEIGAAEQRPNKQRFKVLRQFFDLCSQTRMYFRNGNINNALEFAVETLDLAIAYVEISHKIASNKTPADTDPTVLVRIKLVVGNIIDLKKNLERSNLLGSLETAWTLINEVKKIVSALANKRPSILAKRQPVCGPLDKLFAKKHNVPPVRKSSFTPTEAPTEPLGTQDSDDRQSSENRQGTLRDPIFVE